jgi:glutaredoxin
MASDIQVYGADWCGVTQGLRRYLTDSRLTYDYFDVERDVDAEQFVVAMNGGRRRFPVVIVEDHIIVRPTVRSLQETLSEHGIHPLIK